MTRSLGEFLAMGGYAPFVWTAYAAFALVLGLNIAGALGAHARARTAARRRLAARDGGAE